MAVFITHCVGVKAGLCETGHVLHIAARGEHRSCAGQDDGAHAPVRGGGGCRCNDLRDGRVAGERIARGRVVHGPGDDRAVAADLKEVGQGRSPEQGGENGWEANRLTCDDVGGDPQQIK